MSSVMAFDPGQATGWAYLQGDSITSGELHSESQYHKWLYQHLENYDPEEVVYEVFTRRPGILTSQMDAPEYIGVIKLWCKQNGVPAFPQQPAQGKGFWNDDKLKLLKLHVPGRPHANDAIRHLLTYATKRGQKAWLYRLKDAESPDSPPGEPGRPAGWLRGNGASLP